MTVITRFAPSPTGMLHIGNARTALINWLFARKHTGEFILRIDDTDVERSKIEYHEAILKDLEWLGLNYERTFKQSERKNRYDEVKAALIKSGRLYPCFETQEELDLKRKFAITQGKPFIYDRAALKFTSEKKQNLINAGVLPHYRFFLNHTNIEWNDKIKEHIKYHGSNISDPVVIKPDGSMTYLLCSVIDDIDYNITDIIRGEDHITNTAVQIQMFAAIGSAAPQFAHLSLVRAKDDKISKRIGGYEISYMRDDLKLHPMAISSFLTFVGTSHPIIPHTNLDDLVKAFDIETYSKSPTTYIQEELLGINRKLITNFNLSEIIQMLPRDLRDKITEDFWHKIRNNIKCVDDVYVWWKICNDAQIPHCNDDKIGEYSKSEVANQFIESLHDIILSDETLAKWIDAVMAKIDLKKRDIFPHLRLAITGLEHGPELKYLLPLIGRDEVLRRIRSYFDVV